MGWILHNAIVATSWQEDAAAALVAYAESLGAQALMGAPVINGYVTVLIAPDGSKEDWEESAEGDERRAKIKAWIRAAASEPIGKASGHYFEWCEIAYGDDDEGAAITDAPWASA